jgi:hypothetical protein
MSRRLDFMSIHATSLARYSSVRSASARSERYRARPGSSASAAASRSFPAAVSTCDRNASWYGIAVSRPAASRWTSVYRERRLAAASASVATSNSVVVMSAG